jgi:pyrroloquinoline quinone biosynthesis protein D
MTAALVAGFSTGHFVPQLCEGVRLHPDPLNGQCVLLFPEGVLWLNSTAIAVLSLCDGRKSVEEIAAILGAEYDAAPAFLSADIAECLLHLEERRLIRFSRRAIT